MPSNAAQLVVDVTSDTSAAVNGLDDVTAAAREMAREVAEAGRASEDASRKVALSADAADELGGKAGKATGALGALSSGFELVGAEKYAGALQGASMATDFLSGVGDSLNLVMESTIVQNIRARVATVASTVATKAAAVASRTMAAGQWLLNAALAANPIGLVVLGIAALVAGFVLAYKKSETFRKVVQFAMSAVVGYVKLVTLPWRFLADKIGDLIEKIPGVSKAFRAVKDTAKSIGSALLAPFKAVQDVIQKILDLIGKIHVPKLKLPHIPGLRVAAPSDGGAAIAASSSTTVNSYTINVTGILDADQAAEKIEKLLGRRTRRLGIA